MEGRNKMEYNESEKASADAKSKSAAALEATERAEHYPYRSYGDGSKYAMGDDAEKLHTAAQLAHHAASEANWNIDEEDKAQYHKQCAIYHRLKRNLHSRS